MPSGKNKVIKIYDGASWVWRNEFATSKEWAYNPISKPLVLDINIPHKKMTGGMNIFISTMEGDNAFKIAPNQCTVVPGGHKNGQDYTWIKSGNNKENLYFNIFEGLNAPENNSAFINRPWANYPNIYSLAKGIGLNIIKIKNPGLTGKNTRIHFESDSKEPTIGEQEAFIVNYIIWQGIN